MDENGALKDIDAEGEAPPYRRATNARKKNAKKQDESKRAKFINIVQTCNFGEPPTVKQVAEAMDTAERTVRDWVKNYGYQINKNGGGIVEREDE